jgi:hypothetical protein
VFASRLAVSIIEGREALVDSTVSASNNSESLLMRDSEESTEAELSLFRNGGGTSITVRAVSAIGVGRCEAEADSEVV